MSKDHPAYTSDEVDTLSLGYFKTGIEHGFDAGYHQGYADAVSDALCGIRAHLAAAISADELAELGLVEVFRGLLGADEPDAPAPSLGVQLTAYADHQVQELRELLAA